MQGVDGVRVQHVLHVEDEVFGPANVWVHAQVVLLYDVAPVELVPQHAPVEVRRTLQHEVGVVLARDGAIEVDVALARHALADHAVEVRDDHVYAVVLHSADQQLGGVRGDPVVRVQELHVAAACLVKARVARVRDAGVLLVHHMYALVVIGVGVQDGGGGVGAAVVHQDELVVVELLAKDAVHAAAYALLCVVNRHYDADLGHTYS